MRIRILLFISFAISFSLTHAQISALDSKERQWTKKIAVGMSPAEVKAAVGRPTAIEGGFPQVDEKIVYDTPEQAGQMNNSTWFYILPDIILKEKNVEGGRCYVNGDQVPRRIYDAYLDKEQVYLRFGKVIDPVLGESYEKLYDRDLSVQNKSSKTTYMIAEPSKTVEKVYKPVFCVIFDKGTQVVAACRMFFITSRF